MTQRKTRAKSLSKVVKFGAFHNHAGHGHPYRGVSMSVREWRENTQSCQDTSERP